MRCGYEFEVAEYEGGRWAELDGEEGAGECQILVGCDDYA